MSRFSILSEAKDQRPSILSEAKDQLRPLQDEATRIVRAPVTLRFAQGLKP
jgi:hypothetical protein